MGLMVEWLISEPVHFLLVYVLSVLTVMGQVYRLLSHLRARRRMLLTALQLHGLRGRVLKLETTLNTVKQDVGTLTDPGKLKRLQDSIDSAVEERDTQIKRR